MTKKNNSGSKRSYSIVVVTYGSETCVTHRVGNLLPAAILKHLTSDRAPQLGAIVSGGAQDEIVAHLKCVLLNCLVDLTLVRGRSYAVGSCIGGRQCVAQYDADDDACRVPLTVLQNYILTHRTPLPDPFHATL